MKRVVMILVSALALAGCGIKGPLYVPGVPKDAPWPYPSPPPAPQPPTPKVPDVPGTSDEKK
ncbi:MAG: lipoprotein [Burkholderiales bacterium]|nr:lipoprotein [Burkholderiales bacterium]